MDMIKRRAIIKAKEMLSCKLKFHRGVKITFTSNKTEEIQTIVHFGIDFHNKFDIIVIELRKVVLCMQML